MSGSGRFRSPCALPSGFASVWRSRPGDETPWRIEYLLQSAKDPSLLLNARDAWSAKRTPAAALGGEAGAVREHLLASLGQAASICPLVAASLDARAPDGYDTDVLGAHRFLRETAPALEQSGFGVMLPAWWTRRGTAARVESAGRGSRGPAASSAGLTLGSLIDFDWQVALGDQEISYKELAALAKLKTPLVKVRGQWVEVDANAIKAALDFLKKNPSGRATLGETVRMAVGADGEAGPLEIEGVSATGWMGDVLARLEGRVRVEELPQPEAFEGRIASLPALRLFLARFSQAPGTRRVPGRRHGPRQDGSDPGADRTRARGGRAPPGPAGLPHLGDRKLA